jgi:hypothetical protein
MTLGSHCGSLWLFVLCSWVFAPCGNGSIADVSGYMLPPSSGYMCVGLVNVHIYTYTPSHFSYSVPPDGSSVYIRNIVGTANFHTLQRPKSTTSTDMVCKDVVGLRTTGWETVSGDFSFSSATGNSPTQNGYFITAIIRNIPAFIKKRNVYLRFD